MSSDGKRPYLNGKATAPQPRDECEGEWTRSQRLRMDLRFCAAMERAIKRGLERRPDGEASERAA